MRALDRYQRLLLFLAVSCALLAQVFLLPVRAEEGQAPPAPERPRQYIVQPGDTLYSIARRFGVEVSELMRLNHIQDPTTLKPGQPLLLGEPLPALSSRGLERRINNALLPESSAAGSGTASPGLSRPPVVPVSPEEVELLARLVHAEARGEPYEGKVAVAAVVINRVRSGAFPNTIRGVIFQPAQFKSVENGQIELPPDQESWQAAREAIAGRDPTGGALYFYNPQKSTALSWWSTRTVTAVIGNHNFAR
ncbi:MAG: cell wall hydrolase [Bacillota bacterium]|nr:cell wall hydrolase [Bacillota bacterium]